MVQIHFLQQVRFMGPLQVEPKNQLEIYFDRALSFDLLNYILRPLILKCHLYFSSVIVSADYPAANRQSTNEHGAW